MLTLCHLVALVEAVKVAGLRNYLEVTGQDLLMGWM